MKKNTIVLSLLTFTLTLISSCNQSAKIDYTVYEDSTVSFKDFSDPNDKNFDKSMYYRNDLTQDMGDPMMIYEDGTFYAYGTYDTTKIWCFTSTNLTDWNKEEACFVPELNSWSKSDIWAPDLQIIDGKYYMYYTANYKDGKGSNNCQIGVAIGDNPRGPFMQYTGVNANGENIPVNKPAFFMENTTILDQHVFQDDDGQLYMYFSLDTNTLKDDRNNGTAEIWGVKMKDPVTWDLSTLTRLMSPGYQKVSDETRSIEWETWSPSFAGEMECQEGPYMIKKDGKYYLTYCANSYVDTEYAVGYGVADSPLGEYVKPNNYYLENMLLGVPGQEGTYINTRYLGFQTGTGHASICKVEDEYMFAYHAHLNRDKWGAHEDIYGDKAKWRALAVDYLYFDENSHPYTNGPTYSLQRLPKAVSGYSNIMEGATITCDGENVEYLQDNFTNRGLRTPEVAKETDFKLGKHAIEINFNKEVTIKAVNIFNSYDYKKAIEYVNQIDFGNNKGIVNALFNSSYVNKEMSFIFPHSAVNVLLDEEITTSRIVIEVESDHDFALGEIEILGR